MEKRKLCWLFSRGVVHGVFALLALALVQLHSAQWAYWFIAELYPLGAAFVPTVFSVIITLMVLTLGLLITCAMLGRERVFGLRAVKPVFCVAGALAIALVLYTTVLLFGFDSGIRVQDIAFGMQSLVPNLALLAGLMIVPLVFVLLEKPKRMTQALVCAVVITAMLAVPGQFAAMVHAEMPAEQLPPVFMRGENVLAGASVIFETEEGSAANLLTDDNSVWQAYSPWGRGYRLSAVAEIQLVQVSTFNVAMIEEIGNEVQYFRLQAWVDDEWVLVYQSEKIQALRLLSFDPVTTDRVRLSIDRFRSMDTPALIRSLRLYDEPMRENERGLNITAYQRIDGDVPTEILARGEEFVRTYAQFYDVYNTIIIFGAMNWDSDGNMTFGRLDEDGFAREIAALREIIDHRSNLERKVNVIITLLPDGAFGPNHTAVNDYMHIHYQRVADEMVEFMVRHGFDGIDIDWEYPQNANDWRLFDRFIERLHDGMLEMNPDAILSGAFSAWALGMRPDILQRFDQIQLMSYDGNDMDGFQSSLQQAQEGLVQLVNAGASLDRINIGIAAYGRPIVGGPFWKEWRYLDTANYWDNMYYNVRHMGQIYHGTFNSPALAGDKLAYALFAEVGGVMLFRVACDKLMDNPLSLARGLENAAMRHLYSW